MLRRLLVPALLASAMAVPAVADDGSRYSEWSPEGTGAASSPALEALAEELGALIDEAENARAADPRFLQDLRDIIAAHIADATPREALILDDFSDGDFTGRSALGGGERRLLDRPPGSACAPRFR